MSLTSMDPKDSLGMVGEHHYNVEPSGSVVVGDEALNVRLVSYSTEEQLLRATYDIVMATWDTTPAKWINATPAALHEVFGMAMRGQTLPAAARIGSFTFSVQGVSRASTHQLVRHGNVNIGQNSSRCNDFRHRDMRIMPTLSKYQSRIEMLYLNIMDLYADMVDDGIQVQDARYLLPDGVVTGITMEFDLGTFMGMFRQRGCYNMMPETVRIAHMMRDEVLQVLPFLAPYLKSSCELAGKCIIRDNLQEPCGVEGLDPNDQKEYHYKRETNASLSMLPERTDATK